MQLLEHFHKLSIHPKNAKELKGLILQLAVQGRLTKKWRVLHPNVKHASELLEQIKAEKKLLIAEKKIKKEKPLPPIAKSDINFIVPNNWSVTRLGELGDWGAGATPLRSKSEFYGGDINWFKSGELNNGIIDYDSNEKITELAISKSSLRLNKAGDVLIAMYGATIGKTGLLKVEGTTNQAVCACTCFSGLSNLFLHLLLKALRQDFLNQGEGGAQPNISRVKIRNKVILFPPLEEQKAIVKIVEQLFKEVEQLEQLTEKRIQLKEDFVVSALHQLQEKNTKEEWGYLQKHFHTFFTEENNIKKLRETILQLAVQGKLTKDWRKQNPNVEPASELLRQIKAEKEQLIVEKKIKKEKPLPPITEDEIPYELPDGWAWSYMKDLCQYITDGTHQTPNYVDKGRMFLSAKNVKPFRFMPEVYRCVSEEAFEGYRKNRKPELNDVLLTRVGAGIGEAALIDKDIEFAIYVSIGLLKMFPEFVEPRYLVIWLNSPEGRSYSAKNTYGKGVSQGNLNLSLIRGFKVSFPPLEEQKEIVKKVHKLMILCDQLEEQVRASQEQSEKLMQSVLREVFSSQEKENITLDDYIPNIDKYIQVAMITQKMENAFGFNHGKVEKQKTSFLLKTVKKQPISYNFEKSNYGTFSWELSEDLDSNPFLQKSSTDKGSVYQVKSNKQNEVLTALNAPENSSFVQAIDELVQVYQNPLISGKTDQIELLNTICKLILDLKTNDLEVIYKAMQEWQIKQNGFNTKADKFSKKDTEKMLRLVVKLGWDKELIKM